MAKVGKAVIPTDAEIEAGALHGANVAAHEPRGRAVLYDRATRHYTVELAAGATLAFAAAQLSELADATDDQLADVRLSPSGLGLRWRALDVDINLTGLVMDLVAGEGWRGYFRSLLVKDLAGIKTEAKAAASRMNGAKGGRPPRVANLLG
jgi:hypothetical protein